MDDGRGGAAIPAAQREAIRRGAFSKDKLLSKPLSEVWGSITSHLPCTSLIS